MKHHLQKNPPSLDAGGYLKESTVPTQPLYVKDILLVNKWNALPPTFDPGEDQTTRQAFEEMRLAAKQEGITLTIISFYRSYDYQTQLYTNYVKRDGQTAADRYSARPGHSEHQSGLAIDIGDAKDEEMWFSQAFGNTEAGKWLSTHASSFGFILRYLKGKEEITGYMYEPWHFRYVGVAVAEEITSQGLTLEEYLIPWVEK